MLCSHSVYNKRSAICGVPRQTRRQRVLHPPLSRAREAVLHHDPRDVQQQAARGWRAADDPGHGEQLRHDHAPRDWGEQSTSRTHSRNPHRANGSSLDRQHTYVRR